MTFDLSICSAFCLPFRLKPTCTEEHEAWHVQWIQAAITKEEFIALFPLGA